ncbi:MAG: hypothetical protein DMG96_26270 [Acidobacteria bacterium]|nr:MAG: hypothetical protein DMG96_26270 [Acidobacteriota bacterium]
MLTHRPGYFCLDNAFALIEGHPAIDTTVTFPRENLETMRLEGSMEKFRNFYSICCCLWFREFGRHKASLARCESWTAPNGTDIKALRELDDPSPRSD